MQVFCMLFLLDKQQKAGMVGEILSQHELYILCIRTLYRLSTSYKVADNRACLLEKTSVTFVSNSCGMKTIIIAPIPMDAYSHIIMTE